MSRRFANAIARIEARRRIRRQARARKGIPTCVDDVRCLRPIFHSQRCFHHFVKWLDIAWGQRVRKGYCELDRAHQAFGVVCSGRIEACHVVPRGYVLTRWSLENGLSGCHAVNQIGEDDPPLWRKIAIAYLHAEKYDELWLRATAPKDIDYDAAMREVGVA